MNGIVIYKGRYGATEQYAGWISKELGLASAYPEQLDPQKLSTYDLIIAGGSVYVGKFQIADWLHKNASLLKNKKLVLFIVCATPTTEKKELDKIAKSNVPAVLHDQCNVFFLPGRMLKKNLSWKDRIVLQMGAMLQNDPEKKRSMLTDFDEVKKENLLELLNMATAILKNKELITL